MIDDTVLHAMTLVKDGGLWRSRCVCGWESKLCRNKAAAERSKFYHIGSPVTVTSKRSLTPVAKLRHGMTTPRIYPNVSKPLTAHQREKAKKNREEAKVKKAVRASVAERDGPCRLGKARTYGLMQMAIEFGACTGMPQWAHFGKMTRAKTLGQSPEERHSTAGSVMLCGGPPHGGHHWAYDKGTGAKKLTIEALTDRGCDGPLRFTLNGIVYEEQDGQRSES